MQRAFDSICICLFITVATLSWNGVTSINIPATVRRPPTIIEQTQEIYYALPQTQIQLKCAADALPEVKTSKGYYWTKDGKIINFTRDGDVNSTELPLLMSDQDGSLYFNGTEFLDSDDLIPHEGSYQCFASNEWGTAVSKYIDLKIATMVRYVRPEDQVIEVREGESKQVACRQSNGEDIGTWWNFNPDNVQLSNRIAQASDGTIIFSNVMAKQDQGLRLYCTWKYLPTRSSIDGAHYTLSVKTENPAEDREPEIIRPKVNNEKIIVLKDEELKLTCIAIGKPTPSVYWTRKDKVLSDDDLDRYEMRDFNRTLYVRNAMYEDEGTYSCTAMNEMGLRKRDVIVAVQSRPYFPLGDAQPTDMIKVPGDTAAIKCAPEGIPAPEVQWLVNGIPIADVPDNPNRVVYSDRIVLTNLNETDTAVYQCIGRNEHGIVMGQGFVNVIISPPFPLTRNSIFYRTMEGNAVDMECRMFASPGPDYNWTKLDNYGEFSLLSKRFKIKKTNSLKITNTTTDDTGTYTCEATNEYGSASINVTLLVVSSTIVRPREETGRYTVTKGDDAFMAVEIFTHPNLTWRSVTWFKDGYEVGNNLQMEVLDVSMEDAGKYTVLVETDLDKAKTSVKLIVQDVPEAPDEVLFTVSDNDAFSGILNWEAPYSDNNSPVEEYKVEYEASKLYPRVWNTMVESVNSAETRTEINNLEPWVTYSFRVWARNAIGWSNYASGKTKPYLTPPKAPSVNPSRVKGEGNDPDNMVISWDPVDPIKFSGPGFGYEVSWCLESNCNWTVNFDNIANVTSYTVTGTPPYTRYLINVTSANDVGKADPPVPVIGYSGEDVPLASPSDPKSVVSDDGKVTISWQPVPEDEMRGMVTGYRVLIKNKDLDEDRDVPVDPYELSVDLELDPFTNYEFNVIAKNSAGESEPSMVTRLKTPEGYPEAPEDFQVRKRKLNSLRISWKEPAKKNGIIKKYRVQYGWADGNSTKENTTKTKGLNLTLDDLDPDMTYYITLCAATSRGFSDDCAVLSTSTLTPQAPNAPEFDVITDETLANITWMTSDDEDGVPARSFNVQYRLAHKEDEIWTQIGEMKADPEKWHFAATVNELKPGSAYEFRVVATNDYGTTKTNSSVFSTVGSQPQQATVGILGAPWFIAVMCIIPLIIFLIVIICFLRRRKGGKYSVSEKEEQLVKLDSQPMNNDESGKYSVNPGDDGENGGATSPINDPLQSRRTRGDSVGGNSIEVFGSGDTRDFEEDGSFIDQYGVDRRSQGKSEGIGSPISDEAKDLSDARSKLLSESGNAN